MDLPVYQVITEGSELTAVALVDRPAIERAWMAFSEKKAVKLQANESRRIITGPLLIPDQLIYRDQDGMQFYLQYTVQSIEGLLLDFMSNRRNTEINLMHNDAAKPEGVFIFEIFQSDASRGILPPTGFQDLPDGTLFASAKVDNSETWAKIQDGTLTGFSIEAWINPVKVDQELHDLASEFCQLVNKVVNKANR